MTLSLVLVGAGVRGTAALGRLAARLRSLESAGQSVSLELHVVDPFPPGAGAIWRTGQPRSLVMNTVAAQSTVFDDPSLEFESSLPGPSFAEWCAGIASGAYVDVSDEPASHTCAATAVAATARVTANFTGTSEAGSTTDSTASDVTVLAGPTIDTSHTESDSTAWVRELASEIVPWSTPSRELYGRYLRWAFRRFADSLPTSVRLILHEDRAVSINRTSQGFEIELAGAKVDAAHDVEGDPDRAVRGPVPTEVIRADAVLLALGWLPRQQGDAQPSSQHFTAGSPIDQGLDRILPGERIAVRGIGMGFIDLLSIVTEHRGGIFEPDVSHPDQIRYTPNGNEPRVFAGSRTGLPFLAKPEFGTVPPGPRFDALKAAMPELLARRPLDFGRDIMPLIDHAAAWEHYRALAEHRPAAFSGDPNELLILFEKTDEPLAWRAGVETCVPNTGDRYDPERVGAPIEGSTARDLDEATMRRIEFDAADAALGHASPRKRGLHVFQAARVAIIPLTEFGGVTEESRPQLNRFLSLANLIGSGPPLFRVKQLIALHRAGIVTFVGPELEVHDRGEAEQGESEQNASTTGDELPRPVHGQGGPGKDVSGQDAPGQGLSEQDAPGQGLSEQDLSEQSSSEQSSSEKGSSGQPARRYEVRSALAPKDGVPIDRVVDAYLDLPNVTRLQDPLIDSLIEGGLARVWQGDPLKPTLEISTDTSALIAADGTPVGGLHSVGPLHEELRRFTIIAPIPGVRSTVLREIDEAIAAMLEHALPAAIPSDER